MADKSIISEILGLQDDDDDAHNLLCYQMLLK